MHCADCKVEIEDGAKICNSCGAEVFAVVNSDVEEAAVNKAKKACDSRLYP